MFITSLTGASVVISNDHSYGFSWSYQNEGICCAGQRQIEIQALFAGSWSVPVKAVTDDFGNLVQIH